MRCIVGSRCVARFVEGFFASTVGMFNCKDAVDVSRSGVRGLPGGPGGRPCVAEDEFSLCVNVVNKNADRRITVCSSRDRGTVGVDDVVVAGNCVMVAVGKGGCLVGGDASFRILVRRSLFFEGNSAVARQTFCGRGLLNGPPCACAVKCKVGDSTCRTAAVDSGGRASPFGGFEDLVPNRVCDFCVRCVEGSNSTAGKFVIRGRISRRDTRSVSSGRTSAKTGFSMMMGGINGGLFEIPAMTGSGVLVFPEFGISMVPSGCVK